MQNGFTPILILIPIAIAALVGGGLVYYNQTKQTGIETSLTASLRATPIEDETANWKTYTNEKDGYSLKYPNNLKHSTSTQEGIVSDTWIPSNEAYVIHINSYGKIVNPFWEFHAETRSDEIIAVEGQQVRKRVGTEVISNKGTLLHVGPFKHLERNYFIVYTSGNNIAGQESLRIFDQILSTFKFLDQNNNEKPIVADGYISWEEAIKILNGGQVTMVVQGHNLEVQLNTKDGKVYKTFEPKIDEILKEIEECQSCGKIAIGIE